MSVSQTSNNQNKRKLAEAKCSRTGGSICNCDLLRDTSRAPAAYYNHNILWKQRFDAKEKVSDRQEHFFKSTVPTYGIGVRYLPTIDALPLNRVRGSGLY